MATTTPTRPAAPSAAPSVMSAARKPDGVVRILGIITMVAGAIFLIAGGITWGAVSTNLKAENITVSPDAAHFGGAVVDTPWEAFSQADIINHHALAATDGKTYAELGGELHALEAQLTEEGATAEEIKANPDMAQLTGQRTTVMNGSFLRASLFTSVIAFGVAALVMGLGAVFGIVGYAITRTQKAPAAA